MEINTLKAINGALWVRDGYRLFRKDVLGFISIFILYVISTLLLLMIPFAGTLLYVLLQPVLLAGIMFGLRDIEEQGGAMKSATLIRGFRESTGTLFAIGVLYMTGLFLLFLIFAASSLISLYLTGTGKTLTGIITIATFFIATIGLVMATWFAPLIVIFEKKNALSAMKLSFQASVKNALPLTIYGFALLGLVISILGTAGFGLLVVGPVYLASIYASYMSVFKRKELNA